MRLKKQSMRQLKDAALLDRGTPDQMRATAAMVDELVHSDPLKRPEVPPSREKPIYIRGALVRTNKRD